MTHRIPLACLAVLLAAPAAAEPIEMIWQGHVFESSGVPLNGTTDVSVTLRPDATETAVPLWTDTFANVDVSDGYLHLVLGSNTPLDLADFPVSRPYIRVKINGMDITGPARLHTVPYAVRAEAVTLSDDTTCDAEHAGRFSIGDGGVVRLCGGASGWLVLDAVADPSLPGWTPTLETQGGATGQFEAVLALSDGRFVGAGSVSGGTVDGTPHAGAASGLLRMYSAAGVVDWEREIGGTATDSFNAVIELSDGRLLAVGTTSGTVDAATAEGGYDGFASLFAGDGTEVWTRQYGSQGYDQLHDAIATDDGGAFLCMSTAGDLGGTSGDLSVHLVRIDATGAVTSDYRGTMGGSDFGYSCGLLPNGDIAMAGQVNYTLPGLTSSGDHDAAVQVMAQDGTTQTASQFQFGSSTTDSAFSMDIHPDGRIALAGLTWGQFPGETQGAMSFDGWVAVVNADQTLAWAHQISGSGNERMEAVHWLPDGTVFATGQTAGEVTGLTSSGGNDRILAHYAADGTLLSLQQEGTAQSDTAQAITVAQDGDVVLGGSWSFDGTTSVPVIERRQDLP